MKHFYEKIPGWFNCLPLYERCVSEAKNGATFVEVGAWKGRSAAFMGVEIANSGKRIAFYVIDNFGGSAEHQKDEDVVNGTLEETFRRNVEPVKEFMAVIKNDSVKAAEMFEDGSLDFVYIDASHDYEDVKADINAWLPKVRKGGMLAGDDYLIYPGVKQAVDELLSGAMMEGIIWMYRV